MKRKPPKIRMPSLQKLYETDSFRYEGLCLELVKQLEELLKTARIKLPSPIEWRVKSWASTLDKVKRNQVQPNNLTDIHDIAGVRIIALFRRDLIPIQKIIEENFSVLQKEDTLSRLRDNRFGYGSIHYEVQPPSHWSKIPTLRKFDGLRAEIQVRTGSQHIWAAASHVLQYKAESHVPPPVRRTINRVAALLETVDLEFERVLLERQQYAKDIQTDVQQNLPLNTESLRQLLDSALRKENLDDGPEDYADLLDELLHFGVSTTDQLERLIKKHLRSVLESDEIHVRETLKEIAADEDPPEAKRAMRGVYFTHAGLTRGVLSNEFHQKFSEYQSKKYGLSAKEDSRQ